MKNLWSPLLLCRIVTTTSYAQISYKIKDGVKIKAIAIDLRYGFGLTNLRDKDALFSMQNRSLQLCVEFPLVFRR